MQPKPIRPHTHQGVFTDGSDLYTQSSLEGAKEPGTTLRGEDGGHYRPFPPTRTKLAAIIKREAKHWPFLPGSRVLYLGAAAGTTVSYLSDICSQGEILAVEFAPEPFRDLVKVARSRPNVVPILADARRPQDYRVQVAGSVDVIYQDIAQRDQWEVLRRNAEAFLAPEGWAVLVLKARSVSVNDPAHSVYDGVRQAAEAAGYRIMEFIDLDPFDREHGVFILKQRP
jgi:fibrillarin-like pre-rRNA processing protein